MNSIDYLFLGARKGDGFLYDCPAMIELLSAGELGKNISLGTFLSGHIEPFEEFELFDALRILYQVIFSDLTRDQLRVLGALILDAPIIMAIVISIIKASYSS